MILDDKSEDTRPFSSFSPTSKGVMEQFQFLDNSKHLSFIKSRPFRRVASIVSAVIFLVLMVVFGTRHIDINEDFMPVVKPRYPSCSSLNIGGDQDLWKKIQKKHSHLADDKFTIAMLTYQRPEELKKTLEVLTSEKIPSLHEIVVVWGDIKAEVPQPSSYKGKSGVPVRYRKALEDSLNEKLRPDADFETQAVLLTDEDVYYKPQDLEFVFQTWRKFGKNRLVGALPRCSNINALGKFNYNFCDRKDNDAYSMILTNLAFSHIAFMDYYWSNDTTMNAIREYVDDGMNCEDIAMNYVQSILTGEGPLLVNGQDKYVNLDPPKGISRKPGHLEARSKCLNDFAEMFQCMPLTEEYGHMQKGVHLRG